MISVARITRAGLFSMVVVATCFCLENVSSFGVSDRQTKNHVRLADVTRQQSSTESKILNIDEHLSRRSMIGHIFSSIMVGFAASQPQVAMAVVDNGIESVYFGVGCFWHIQHEFLLAEKSLLQRSNSELTSKAGYAGGTKTGPDGKVCYHNLQFIADYGKLGHGEVVGMDIPRDRVVEFSEVYFSLFNPKTKERVDPQDRGGEYRSLIGLPGGINHPSYAGVEAAAKNAGFRLEVGNGNDPDTLGKQLVYVYDTAKFPFYQAEIYHQYHNDFQSPPYGAAYNKLADVAFSDGRLKVTGCPDRV